MRAVAASIAALALLAGCQTMQDMWSGGAKATANLEPTKGSNVRGKVDFVQSGSKVRVTANITGLRPSGEFGFHIRRPTGSWSFQKRRARRSSTMITFVARSSSDAVK